MAIKSSGGYNSPEMAQVAGQIAQMFGPPSAGELAAYSTARANNQKSNIVAQLAQNPQYQGFDQQAILADLYDPTQSFTRVNMDDATTRRGQDVDASTSITNNQNTNRTNLISGMFGALNEGQVRPALPGSIASSFGLPELPQVAGTPKPLSQADVLGGETQRLIASGQIGDADLISTIMGGTPVENVVGPDGQPMIQYRDRAVGSEPYFSKGADAKPTNGVARLRDGTTVPAVQDTTTGRWKNAQTGADLPSDIQIFNTPQAQGTAEEVGLATATNNQVEQQLIDIAVAKDTALTLRDLIAKSPSSQGIVGALRGTAQNVIQTGGELGSFFGGGVADAMDQIKSGLADAELEEAFDPNIPAIDMLSNLLAFQYAKTTTGERLSNEMLSASKRALGLDGLDANQANSLARLNQAVSQIEAQEAILRKARGEGVNSLATPNAPPAVAAPMPSSPSAPAGTPRQIQTEAEYNALPSGELYIDPDDQQTYRKP